MAETWGFTALWRRIAHHHPQRPALAHGDRCHTWADLVQAADAISTDLRSAGVAAGDVVALCLPNCPEYLITFAAALNLGAIPANVNYRYRPGELHDLLTLLQPTAVIHAQTDRATFTALQPLISCTRLWGEVDVSGGLATTLTNQTQPRVSDRQESAVSSPAKSVIIKCTGGTTGLPTAVRWDAATVFEHLNAHNPWITHDTVRDLDHAPPQVANARLVLASPLIHGSALTRALGCLCAGGAVITTPATGFDPEAILDAVDANAADTLAIIGDAHAVPLLIALERNPTRWTLDSLRTITSSGATWSSTTKRSLAGLLPHQVRLVETLGATEATGLGFSTAQHGNIPPTGVFTLGRYARAFRADGSAACPGDLARIGVSHPLPEGLHPDQALPAHRFLRHAGVTFLLSGDHVRVLADEQFAFLGRDEDCINTGGEKVYAPEVAEVLMSHPAVTDAIVFALPHPELGHRVATLICADDTADVEDILRYARRHLAGYKIPRQAHLVDQLPRTGSGKIDLPRVRAIATKHLTEPSGLMIPTSTDP